MYNFAMYKTSDQADCVQTASENRWQWKWITHNSAVFKPELANDNQGQVTSEHDQSWGDHRLFHSASVVTPCWTENDFNNILQQCFAVIQSYACATDWWCVYA